MSLRFDHVVFDLDGTLVDSRLNIASAVNFVMRHFGLAAISVERVAENVGEGARVLIERCLGPERMNLVDDALPLYLARYGEHLLDRTRPYPEIAEMLSSLTFLGVALSVLTNKPTAMSDAILRGLGLRAAFAGVLGGEPDLPRKPDPEGLRRLAAGSGAAISRLLLVGDSLTDWQTAAAGRVGFCGVGWGIGSAKLRARHPETMIERPLDLIEVVGSR